MRREGSHELPDGPGASPGKWTSSSSISGNRNSRVLTLFIDSARPKVGADPGSGKGQHQRIAIGPLRPGRGSDTASDSTDSRSEEEMRLQT